MTEFVPFGVFTVKVGCAERMDQALLSGVQQQEMRQWAQTDTQRFPHQQEEELHCCAGDRDWNRLPREAVESPSGDIPEPSGHNPVLWDDPA